MKKIVENKDCIVIDLEIADNMPIGRYPSKLRIFKDRIEMEILQQGNIESQTYPFRERYRNMKFNYEDLIIMNIVMNEIMHPRRKR